MTDTPPTGADFTALTNRVVLLENQVFPRVPTVSASVVNGDSQATLNWTVVNPGTSPVLDFLDGRDGNDSTGAGPWSVTDPPSTFSRVFDKLVNGTNYNLSVSARNSVGSSTTVTVVASPASVAVPPAPNVVTVTNPGTQTATVGTAVSTQIVASDSVLDQVLTYTVTGLPAGLGINSTGLISGTPTSAGSNSITVTVTDNTGVSASATFTLTVNAAAPPPANTVTVTNPGAQSATVGAAFSKQISASDSNTTLALVYSATGLPAGLSISSAGLISGTPTGAAGTVNVTVTATDYTGASGSATFSAAVAAAPPVVDTITVTNPGSLTGVVGTAFSKQIVATHSTSGAVLTYTATGLPTGVTINSSTGLISGVPTAAAVSTVVVKATDSDFYQGTASFSITTTAATGVTWVSGAYTGHSASQLTAMGTWRGKAMGVASVFTSRDTVANISNTWYLDSSYQSYAIGVPMCTDNSNPVAQDISSAITALANSLNATGKTCYIRLGWEMNLGWAWKVTDANLATWRSRWSTYYDIFKSIMGVKAQVGFNPNGGANQSGLTGSIMQAWVDGKVDWCGPDQYDDYPAFNSDANVATQKTRTQGLNFWASTARTKGVKLAFPEWGVSSGSQWAGNTGNDNPRYINEMMAFMKANRDIMLLDAYFNDPNSYLVSNIFPIPSSNPNAGSAYVAQMTS